MLEITTGTAQYADIPQLKRLWKAVIPSESDSYLQFYFQRRFEPDEVFLLRVNGQPVAMQTAMRVRMMTRQGEYSGRYIYAAMTHPDFRHQGIARQLTAACEEWAASRGCREFASDCELDNTDSLAFHLRCGFAEEGRIICFIKPLK